MQVDAAVLCDQLVTVALRSLRRWLFEEHEPEDGLPCALAPHARGAFGFAVPLMGQGYREPTARASLASAPSLFLKYRNWERSSEFLY